jgi:choline dehydrogenase-like flavoprotein
MLALAPLLVTAAAAGFVSANPDALPRSSHNANNHHRRQFKREITNDASMVNGKTFDFIIAGGGLAGLAVAGRLSEWSNQTVLVIEAGGDGSGTLADGRVIEDMIDIPGMSFLSYTDTRLMSVGNSYLHGLPGSSWDWQYKTVAQTSAANTIKNWPRGKGLGGSGAVNGMYWNRGNRENYEAWKSELHLHYLGIC